MCGFLIAAGCQIGCSGCAETVISQVDSPDKQFVATSYVRDCGPTTPFNAFVRIGQGRRTTTILTIWEVSFEPRVTWLDADHLKVTIDCPADRSATCDPPTNRAWSVTGVHGWEKLQVVYEAGERLRKHVPESTLARALPKWFLQTSEELSETPVALRRCWHCHTRSAHHPTSSITRLAIAVS